MTNETKTEIRWLNEGHPYAFRTLRIGIRSDAHWSLDTTQAGKHTLTIYNPTDAELRQMVEAINAEILERAAK